jgi:nitrogen fixation protein FixH
MAAIGAKAKAGVKGIHVLWMLLGFFAMIIAVNAVFITMAVRSHPGEQVKNSYVLGLEYNKELARQDKQRTLGWTLQAGQADDGVTFLVQLRDAAGGALSGMDVAVRLHVAGVRNENEKVWLVERGPGEYAMAAGVEAPAKVEAIIEVSRERDGPVVFEARKALVLQ